MKESILKLYFYEKNTPPIAKYHQIIFKTFNKSITSHTFDKVVDHGGF